jgi:hypothetical protein
MAKPRLRIVKPRMRIGLGFGHDPAQYEVVGHPEIRVEHRRSGWIVLHGDDYTVADCFNDAREIAFDIATNGKRK